MIFIFSDYTLYSIVCSTVQYKYTFSVVQEHARPGTHWVLECFWRGFYLVNVLIMFIIFDVVFGLFLA